MNNWRCRPNLVSLALTLVAVVAVLVACGSDGDAPPPPPVQHTETVFQQNKGLTEPTDIDIWFNDLYVRSCEATGYPHEVIDPQETSGRNSDGTYWFSGYGSQTVVVPCNDGDLILITEAPNVYSFVVQEASK